MSIFSKFHSTFDENDSLRFFFAFDMAEIEGAINVADINLLKYRYNSVDHSYIETPEKINANLLINMNIDNEGLFFVSGVDENVMRQTKYQYVVTVVFNVLGNTGGPQNYKRPKLDQTTGTVSDRTTMIKHAFPITEFCEGVAIDEIMLDENIFGFKVATQENILAYLTEDHMLITKQNKKFWLFDPYELPEGFVRIEKKSKIEKLGGLNIGTKDAALKVYPKYDPKKYMQLDVLTSASPIHFEYLANYDEEPYMFSIFQEKWETLSAEAISGIPAGSFMLTRTKNPEDVVNKYFFIQGGTGA